MMKTMLLGAALALTVTGASAQVAGMDMEFDPRTGVDPVVEIDRQMAVNNSQSSHLNAEGLPLAVLEQPATFAARFGYWQQVDGGMVPLEVVMFEGKPVVVLPVVAVQLTSQAWWFTTVRPTTWR
jgi:hypothetical protein